MKSKVSNWTGKFEVYFLGLSYVLFSTNGLATKSGKGVLGISTNRVLCFLLRCWNKLNQYVYSVYFSFKSRSRINGTDRGILKELFYNNVPFTSIVTKQ